MKKKIVCFIMSMLLMNTVCLLTVSASVEVPAHENINAAGEDRIVPYADVIETRFRTYKGKLQYRRWNLTKNCWVDPYWIDM